MILFRVLLPLIGAGLVFWGYYEPLPDVLYVGVGTCVLSLIVDMGAKALSFPVIPTAFVVAGTVFLGPWPFGAALGLAGWAVLDAIIKVGGGQSQGA